MLFHGITNGGSIEPMVWGNLSDPSSYSASSDLPFEQSTTSLGPGTFPGLQERTHSFPIADAESDQAPQHQDPSLPTIWLHF